MINDEAKEEYPTMQEDDFKGAEDWGFIDDISGEPLKSELVIAARHEELEYVHQHGVYEKCPYEQAMSRTGRPPIKVRWVDINKGDVQRPRYRSRLVAQEFKSQEFRTDTFAATPPIEALRVMLALGVMELEEDQDSDGEIVLSFMDVSRAHFHSPSRRDMYVELCPEDAEEGCCALLKKSMYGTRDAAVNWEAFYVSTLAEVEFQVRKYSTCLFWHPTRRLRVWVHGDDFVARGGRKQVMWLYDVLKTKMDMKLLAILGPGPKDAKEVTILNRIVRLVKNDDSGFHDIEYESDPRHAQIMQKQHGLEKSKPVATVRPQSRTKYICVDDPHLRHLQRCGFCVVETFPPSMHMHSLLALALCLLLSLGPISLSFSLQLHVRYHPLHKPSEAPNSRRTNCMLGRLSVEPKCLEPI